MTESSLPEALGFRRGAKGTHTSRTIMLDELDALLAACPAGAGRAEYAEAVLSENVLNKPTVASRRLTLQRLTELYVLDGATPQFRVLRQLWPRDPAGRPMLALLCALARDPLLRATAEPVLALEPGQELARQQMTDAVRLVVGERLNDSTIDKVVRNTSSSWTQSGHLKGRSRKFRQAVRPAAASVAYALMLGYLQGFRGLALFNTLWTRVLCCGQADLRNLAAEAKRLGHLDIKTAGDIVEVAFPALLTPKEIKESRVTH